MPFRLGAVDLNESAGLIRRALKSQTRHVQAADKCIDDPAHVIIRNQLFQDDWKQSSLRSALTLHKAHNNNNKDALAFTRPSPQLFSDGQQSLVTVCGRPPLFAFY